MGMVHIYTGDGKGKTSSATGLAIRCAGHGKKVKIYQFLKATPTGELDSFKKLGIDVVRINTCESFYYDMTEAEKQTEFLSTADVKPPSARYPLRTP